MPNDFIASTIRRLNLRLLFTGLAGLLLVFIGLVFGARFLYNMLLGPFPLTQAELIALSDAKSRLQYYVVVQGDDHADTGFTYVSTSDSGKETTEAYYHALLLGKRLLLVKSRSTEIENTVTGSLENVPADTQKELIAEVEKEVPQMAGAFLPIMLDASNFYAKGYLGLGIAVLVGLASLAAAGLALYRLLNPQEHPALKALSRFGALQAVTGEIDMDMGVGHEQVGKNVHFTRRWLVSTSASLQAMPFRDIIWCYKQVTQHRTNGIPTGKTYAAYILDRHGKTMTIPGKEPQVDQILQATLRSAPGVAAGYSPQLTTFWQKDRLGFVAAVDERRRTTA